MTMMYSLAKNTQSLLHRQAMLSRSASMPTNAALDLHHHFWDSFENRSLMHSKQCDCQPLPSSLEEVQKDVTSYAQGQDQLVKNAHEDLLKHFRMNASLRAMKRGDGILSDNFSLNHAVIQGGFKNHASSFVDQEMTLIDVETARKAREDMNYNFWRAHKGRQEMTERLLDNEEISHKPKSDNQDVITPHAVHPDKNRSRNLLPSSLHDIQMEFGISSHHSNKAIAITETNPPFKIIDVNKAWVDLCGYSRKHAIGSTLKLLQGPETNVQAANKLVSCLLAKKETAESGEYETVLTNYRSDGRKFRNHIRVGLVRDDDGKVVNFVGVFKRLDDDDEMII
jgi:PAS domain S-box-containing protein